MAATAPPPERSIYRSPEAATRVAELYDHYVAAWPVAVEATDLETRYGSVHVLTWGPTDGRPVLLLHAASMAATSWAPNASALADAGFRCYAPDHIGEAGRSRLRDLASFPSTATQIGEHYLEVVDRLGLEHLLLVGASAGGHAALRLVLAAPGRVSRLALLGPMGIAPLGAQAILRMMLASLLPTERVARSTARWALGNDPRIVDGYGRWFSTVLRSVASPPRVGRPVALSADEMKRIGHPVLLVLGDRDNLVGDPRRATELAASFPDLRVEVVSSGHLVGVERAGETNGSLRSFLDGGPT